MKARYYCNSRDCDFRWIDVLSKTCKACGGENRLNRTFDRDKFPSTINTIVDYPEHFNVSLGEVVKSRRHLREIQKQRGLQDAEPVKRRPLPERPPADAPLLYHGRGMFNERNEV